MAGSSVKKSSPILILLTGLGQIMLQSNPITGLCFLVGVCYGSLLMGVAAVLSVACGTITAKFLKYPKEEIENGLYGFSPALVGVALLFYFQPVWVVWILVIVGSSLSAMLQHFFIIKKFPAFTLPFVLVTWLIIFGLKRLFLIPSSDFASSDTSSFSRILNFLFNGYGQVIFQGNYISGILFFIGVFICSPLGAIFGLVGGLISATLSYLFSISSESIEMGLYSYNAVLSAIAFAGNRNENYVWACVAILLTLIISTCMFIYNVTQLTFPFVMGTVITILIKKTANNNLRA